MKRIRHSTGAALLLLLAGACPCAAWTEDGGYYFQVLTQNEGLSESNVTAVAQDREGFVWLGTQDGLDRHDGYTLRVFRHTTNDPDSLSDSYITALYVDSGGVLWVGTRNGLDRYDAGSESFSRFLNSESDPIGIGHIAEDKPGSLWLATDHGLLHFESGSGQARRQGPATDASQAPLLHDHEGVTWIGTEHGLAQLDPHAGRAVGFMPVVFGRSRITALHEARDQALWVGTADGAVYSIAAGRGIIEPFPRIRALTQSAIIGFADGTDGSLWIGTQDHGLVSRRFDGDWIHLGASADAAHGLPSDHITDLIIDACGALWVALSSPGVARLNPQTSRFQQVSAGRSVSGIFRSGAVHGVTVDPQHRLWLGTETGIYVFDQDYRPVRSFSLHTAGLTGNYVETFFSDHQGRMWVGMRGGGLCRFTAEDGRFACSRHRPGDPGSLSDDSVIAIAEDREGHLWLGTLNGGLDRFDPATGDFLTFHNDPKNPNSLSSNKITSIVVDPSDDLWIGTYGGGVDHFSPKTKLAQRYHTSTDPLHGLSSNNIVTLLQTSPEELWIATTGGLDRLDTGSGAVRAWTIADGLPNDLVFAMIADTLGSLWLGTNNGLVQFDPAKGVRRTYSMYDGLPADEFDFGAAARSSWGTIFMGTVSGLVAFNPVELTSEGAPVRMRFTGLTSYGAPVIPAPGAADALLQTSITEAQELRLPYTSPEINLEFAALGSVNPSRERFAYRLAGLDDRWTYLEPGHHSVSFSALPAGDFVLEVRPLDAGIGAGVLGLRIHVPPPPWRSSWANVIYLLLLSGSLMAFGLRQRRKLALEREQAAISRENEARLQLALWASGEGTWDARPKDAVMYCPELMQSLGYKDMPQPITRHAFLQLQHPDDRTAEYELYQQQLRSESGIIDIEFRIRTSAGNYLWWRLRGKVVERDVQGDAIRAIGMAKDISADKEQRIRLQLAALFMENSTDSIAVLDQGYRIIKVNKAFEHMTGYSEVEVSGKFPAFLSASRDGDSRMADMKELASQKGVWNGEGWIRRSSGENFLGRTQVNPVRDEHGNITHFVAITADITRQRLYEDELQHLASHDALTGLPNRTLLSDRLGLAIAAADADEHVGAVLLSLDSFSRINDSLGHDVGDEVLRETARRLLKTASPGDTVARVGGDTFALLLVARESPEAVQQLVTAMLQALAEPMLAAGETLYLTASAGISLYPRDGQDATTLIKNAESALFKSKVHNRGAHTWYAPSMGAEARDHLEMHTALHRALERGELSVHYQPKLRILTGHVCGVEALVRWHDVDLHWISPSEFIPIAEMSGLIDRLGEWVLATACRDIRGLHGGDGMAPISLAVNLSPKQMQQRALPARIAAILERERFPAERLGLELTENVLMHNPAESVELLKDLRSQGITLAVDDFGTGYSSLGYLRHFPIGEIKVDKSFVQDMDNRYTLAIIKAIVALGRSLGMEVTAEGVEDIKQAQALSSLGCTQLQGYLIAAPMDRDALSEFLMRSAARISN